jgi:hypothetical protein
MLRNVELAAIRKGSLGLYQFDHDEAEARFEEAQFSFPRLVLSFSNQPSKRFESHVSDDAVYNR